METTVTNKSTFYYLGAKIDVYFLNNINDTVNVDTLKTQMNQVFNNTQKYMGNIFDRLNIEVWNVDRADVPISVFDKTTGACITYGIGGGAFAGLTWAESRLVQLNHKYCLNSKDLANDFSHEIGHWFDYISDPENDELQKLWDNIRGGYATKATSKSELLAEDFRLFFGADGAKDFERTDAYNYVQGNKIDGLKVFYTLWKKTKDYLNELKANGCTYSSLNFTKAGDASYFSFTMQSRGMYIPIKIDLEGIKRRVDVLWFNFWITDRKF